MVIIHLQCLGCAGMHIKLYSHFNYIYIYIVSQAVSELVSQLVSQLVI